MADAVNQYVKQLRSDPDTGKTTCAIIQAEDELAAIGMVLGAGWAGARAMTATSGPGISLMSEFVGLAYYAEIPAVIWDIQRIGAQYRTSDAYFPGRHTERVLPLPWRHTPDRALSYPRRRNVLNSPVQPLIWPNAYRRPSSSSATLIWV